MGYLLNLKFVGIAFAATLVASGICIALLKSDISQLSTENAKLKAQLGQCELNLSLQNAAIKSLEVNASRRNEDKIQNISKIYVRDKSCEAELDAYKKLLDSAF
ncbi:hypothetical protein [uncultured Campylobacter sp.]|uniref:hypothetical protein n=1 Tax=uncultured Campylobacter sp. TaxID=218934 RepID=UPI00260880BF|nr:hypothetical protein [uncultured Campylobacter sp.]